MKLITIRALVVTAALGAGAAGAAWAAPPAETDMLWAVKIPMRDGVHLNATVFKPRSQDRPLPVVFTLTPYNSDTYYPRARYFAQNGYVFALVDVRGRGNSEGAFLPFENEGRDGYDTVEWLARQPWCDGKVAMWGGSYAGYDQWATLQNFPPHPGDDRPRRRRGHGRGLSGPEQRPRALPDAVGDLHQRRDSPAEPVRRRGVL